MIGYIPGMKAGGVVGSMCIYVSYCLPFVLYASEAAPLSATNIRVLDNCIKCIEFLELMMVKTWYF